MIIGLSEERKYLENEHMSCIQGFSTWGGQQNGNVQELAALD